MATYSLDNFIKTPVSGDKKLEIYDADGNLRYSLNDVLVTRIDLRGSIISEINS